MLDLTSTEFQELPKPREKKAPIKVDLFYYDNNIVKMFAYATILWGVVGMLAGLLAVIRITITWSG